MRDQRYYLIFILSLTLLTFGCSSGGGLLTLKKLSNSQSAMEKEVKKQNEHFDRLLTAIQSGEMDQYTTQRSIKRAFGNPILSQKEGKHDQVLDVWLYRYATEFFDTDKVYLYFNRSGKLVEWNIKSKKEPTDG